MQQVPQGNCVMQKIISFIVSVSATFQSKCSLLLLKKICFILSHFLSDATSELANIANQGSETLHRSGGNFFGQKTKKQINAIKSPRCRSILLHPTSALWGSSTELRILSRLETASHQHLHQGGGRSNVPLYSSQQ